MGWGRAVRDGWGFLSFTDSCTFLVILICVKQDSTCSPIALKINRWLCEIVPLGYLRTAATHDRSVALLVEHPPSVLTLNTTIVICFVFFQIL